MLLSAPLGEKRVLGIDPGFRTGCKVVVLDGNGNFIKNTAIYPHEPQKQVFESQSVIEDLVQKFEIQEIGRAHV